MTKHKFTFMELPMGQVERDPNQPRRDFGAEGEKNKLKNSIKEYGIEEPLKVSEISDKRYIIMDGHRRYICAQSLGLKHVPCRVYPKMPEGEFETRRYEMQNNRRAWNPLERSEALERIKDCLGFRNNHELADYLHLSKSAVQRALQMRKQRVNYLTLMEKHNLPNGLRFAIVTMLAKTRRIKKIEVDEIVIKIFEKIEYKVITKTREINRLGILFLRATVNEDELHTFLTDRDMTVSELEQRTLQSGFALLIDELIKKITHKRKEGVAFTKGEKTYMAQLNGLLQKAL
jgi:ParB/RepB/Spo0J family partition protein